MPPGASRHVLCALLVAFVGCATTEADGDRALRLEVPASYRPEVSDRPAARSPPARPAPPPPPTPPQPLTSCGSTEEGFAGWLEAFARHAVQQGIPAPTVGAALASATYDPAVLALDRSQRAFKTPFAQFAAAHLTRARVTQGKKRLREDAELLARIEARFGIPREILVAIWGLETGYGADTGSMYALRSLATLAWDCRRADRFRAELLSALRIVARGDLTPPEMIGAWAGELGQTQFLPSSYERFAVDFDGDGRADLIGSSADALASTASYLQGHGWRAGEGFRQGSANFAVLAEWNRSEVYRKTIVLFASKLWVGGKRPAAPRPQNDAR